MRITTKYILYLAMLSGIAVGCKKPYNPKVISSNNSYLVVEGVINSGSDATVISLSQTVNLDGNVKTSVLNNYNVEVEEETGRRN